MNAYNIPTGLAGLFLIALALVSFFHYDDVGTALLLLVGAAPFVMLAAYFTVQS